MLRQRPPKLTTVSRTCIIVRDIAVCGLKANFHDAPHSVRAIDAAFASRIKLERLSKRVLRGGRWISNRVLKRKP